MSIALSSFARRYTRSGRVALFGLADKLQSILRALGQGRESFGASPKPSSPVIPKHHDMLHQPSTLEIEPKQSKLSDAPVTNAAAPVQRTFVVYKHCGPPMLSKQYPNVILLKDSQDKDNWSEIWCPDCGQNGFNRGGKQGSGFFMGIFGLQRHMSATHYANKRPSVEDAQAKCARRVLSGKDVVLIRQGQDPTVKIEMRSAATRPKEEAEVTAGNDVESDEEAEAGD